MKTTVKKQIMNQFPTFTPVHKLADLVADVNGRIIRVNIKKGEAKIIRVDRKIVWTSEDEVNVYEAIKSLVAIDQAEEVEDRKLLAYHPHPIYPLPCPIQQAEVEDQKLLAYDPIHHPHPIYPLPCPIQQAEVVVDDKEVIEGQKLIPGRIEGRKLIPHMISQGTIVYLGCDDSATQGKKPQKVKKSIQGATKVSKVTPEWICTLTKEANHSTQLKPGDEIRLRVATSHGKPVTAAVDIYRADKKIGTGGRQTKINFAIRGINDQWRGRVDQAVDFAYSKMR